MNVLSSSAYLNQLLAVPRPGAADILAFYEHRVGAICTDARLMLAPLDDHLCHRGDGVFESINYRQRRMFQLDAHMERLVNSAASLKLAAPCPWDEIRATILAVAAAGNEEVGAIRVLLGRGPGGFGISPAECPQASLYIVAMRSRIPGDAWYQKGLTAFKSAIPAKQEYLARIKNINYLPNVLMTEEARVRQMDMAFSFDEHGNLAEAAIANVGIVDKDGVLVCPEFTSSLPGTTVLAAFEAAEGWLPTAQRPISEADIASAREVLIFSSGPLCVGVTHYEGRPVGNGAPGPVTQNLLKRLEENLLAQGTAF